MERNLYMKIAFDGSDFHGFQSQPGVRTVQDTLEASMRRTLRHKVHLVGSGRTDAGVHAAAMGCNVLTTSELPTYKLLHALGSRLPGDLAILEVRDAHPDFHARRDAVSKLYRYRIYNARTRPVAEFSHRYVHHYWRALDVERMNEAAGHCIGTMDFRAMAAAGCQKEDTVRQVLHCGVQRYFNEIQIFVLGTGFLYQQVRIMVGTLMEVGRGRWEPDHVKTILASKDRSQAGPTVPARGLSLQWVRYPPDRIHYKPDPLSDMDASSLPEDLAPPREFP